MKYVMIKIPFDDSLDKMVPVIFPNDLVHSVVAEGFKKILRQHGFKEPKVVSAGEVSSLDLGEVSGFSDTLGVSSDPRDANLIQGCDYCFGLVDRG